MSAEPTGEIAFGREGYGALLEAARHAGYESAGFAGPPGACGELLLRHDVDYSPGMALELARINASRSFRGTFFVLVRSQIYNLLSPWTLEAVSAIRALGQDVGLHALVPEGADAATAERCVERDYAILEAEVPGAVPAFAWHNPFPALLEAFRDRARVAGLANAYARPYAEQIRFASDSNMRTSASELGALLHAPGKPSLQLLLHPMIWIAGGSDMLDALAHTWPWVLRERDAEIRQNRCYRKALPDGAPESAVASFAAAWRRAAGRRSDGR